MHGDLLTQISEGGILYILLVIAITMHEFGHAFVASKLGDYLPKLEGRVTLNPLTHMDMTGTVILPILTIALSMNSPFPIVFGWGKPVRVALDNPKTRDRIDFLSTAGGLAMNLVVAAVSAVLMALLLRLSSEDFARVAYLSIIINCGLFVINMIPVPPLDGARILKHIVKMSDESFYALSRWGMFIFFAIILIPQTNGILVWLVGALSEVFVALAGIILSIIS